MLLCDYVFHMNTTIELTSIIFAWRGCCCCCARVNFKSLELSLPLSTGVQSGFYAISHVFKIASSLRQWWDQRLPTASIIRDQRGHHHKPAPVFTIPQRTNSNKNIMVNSDGAVFGMHLNRRVCMFVLSRSKRPFGFNLLPKRKRKKYPTKW